MNKELLSYLQTIYTKYQENSFAIEKFNSYLYNVNDYIEHQVEEKNYRDTRKEQLEHYQAQFQSTFLKENNLLYIPDSSLFITYDSNDYTIVQEDSIWSRILSRINREKHLIPWKQKVRIEILMQIKNNYLTQTIPESETIQKVLSIFSSSIVPNKHFAKYFLTILGDAILRKQTTNIYLTESSISKFLESLQYELNKYVKNNISSMFKMKYHNHDYKCLRLFPLHENITMTFLWENLIKQNGLNIVAVACHYSNIYKSADNFLTSSTNKELKEHVLLLQNKTKEDFVAMFADEMLEKSESLSMKQSEMLFTWKQFLKRHKLFYLMFHKDFFDNISSLFTLNEHKEYMGVTCESIGYIKYFNRFIEETCTVYTDDDIGSSFSCYEISELVHLFSSWIQVENAGNKIQIDETLFLQLVQHFHPNMNIKDNRYITNCSNTLWNKQQKVNDFLTTLTTSQLMECNIKCYKRYCSHTRNEPGQYQLCVSKHYFEELYQKFIDNIPM